MKKLIVLFLSTCSLMACATLGTQQIDWTGQNFDNFVVRYGVPTSQHTLQNGNTAYSFVKQCPYVQTQEEVVVVVNKDNIIDGVSRVGSCPSAYDIKQYNEYVDPQVNYLKEQEYQDEQERQKRRERIQSQINKTQSELFNMDHDSTYKVALHGAQTKLQLAQESYNQWEKKNKESNQKYYDIMNRYNIQDKTTLNLINQNKELLEREKSRVQEAQKELEQAQANLEKWENRRAQLRAQLEMLQSQL